MVAQRTWCVASADHGAHHLSAHHSTPAPQPHQPVDRAAHHGRAFTRQLLPDFVSPHTCAGASDAPNLRRKGIVPQNRRGTSPRARVADKAWRQRPDRAKCSTIRLVHGSAALRVGASSNTGRSERYTKQQLIRHIDRLAQSMTSISMKHVSCRKQRIDTS